MRQQHPILKHFLTSGRNNAATKMSNCAQLYKTYPIEKTTCSYRRHNVANNNYLIMYKILLLVFNATFSNISAISCRSVLVLEEFGVPGENHRPWAYNWYTLSLAGVSRVHSFCNIQSRTRTHAVLVIGLYELLVNPTT